MVRKHLLEASEVATDSQRLPHPNRLTARGAFPVLRAWAAAAFLGFGLLQLAGAFADPEPLTHGDTIVGLHLWAALVALGGGLLLVPRQTAPYAAAAIGIALVTGVGTSLAAGQSSRYEWLPFAFMAVTLSAGTVHYARARARLRWKAAWDAVADREIDHHLRRQARKRRKQAADAVADFSTQRI